GCQRIPVDEMVKIFEKHSYKEFDSNELRASLKKEGIWGLKKYDKYAEIVDPAKFDRTPKFGADKAQIGVLLQKNRDGFFYVSKVFKNSSADRLELKEGAKLLKIDRTLASRLSELEAEFLLTGKAGTRLHAIFEAENGKVLKLGLERGHGFNPMVWGTMTETAGYGYIKISAFVKNISRILEKEALVLTKAGAHTLILDLRSVSAGSFEGAAECAGIFIGNGRGLFTIDSRHRGYAAAFSARPGISAFSKTRFIILVNSQTSSSAEIFAQTMKELLGARVFGTRTGGKTNS
ncbi:MAG: hypothetical protein HY746_04090, partial [Elusimicrobia bacterium]|nr:hypothetical protein [Elusimicrobiota bacterium]